MVAQFVCEHLGVNPDDIHTGEEEELEGNIFFFQFTIFRLVDTSRKCSVFLNHGVRVNFLHKNMF